MNNNGSDRCDQTTAPRIRGESLLGDLAWAVRMIAIRRTRRRLYFANRALFDDMLRPQLGGFGAHVIAYPDAIYHVAARDLTRAREALK